MQFRQFLSWKWVLFVAIVVIAVGGFWWRSSSISAEKKKQTFEYPQRGTVERVVEISGEVDAKEKATLRFLAGGKITYIGAKIGDSVKKWQTIASIDKADLQKNLSKNLNNYMIERLGFEQNKYDRRNIAGNKDTDFLNAQDQYSLQNSVLDVELKDIALKNSSLYAPFSGVLVSAPTEVAGTIVSAADSFLIVNPETMYFSADVDESDISKVQEGMTATIKLDAYPEVEIPVLVHRIAFQSTEASTGTVFGVEFLLPKTFEGVAYRLGMNGDAKISIAKKDDVLYVPLRAITERENKKYVEVKRGNNVESKEVKTGLEDDMNVEIISGLELTDQVFIR